MKIKILVRKSKSFVRLIRAGYSLRSILDLYRSRKLRLPNGSLINLSWTPFEFDDEQDLELVENLKVAVTVHIFYEDFTDYMFELLKNIPCNFDLLVTTPSSKIAEDLQRKFQSNTIKKFKMLDCRITKNVGRNFGPLLTEFSDLLLKNYGVFLHIHSKKSLYSGSEQKLWLEHLIHNLIGDKALVKRILREFIFTERVGLIYPTTAVGMPSWVHSWGKNLSEAQKLSSKLGLIPPEKEFHIYPIGGMFWARTAALSQLLDHAWEYGDFPLEMGQTDGTIHHALERFVSLASNQNNFKTKYVHNQLLTSDSSFAWRDQDGEAFDRLQQFLPKCDLISWDFFDTLVQREYGYPDFAKFEVGKILTKEGLFSSPIDYSQIRNSVESSLRARLKVGTDLDLPTITAAIVKEYDLAIDPNRLAELEFEEDLKLFRPRLDIAVLYHAHFQRSVITSDSYYSSAQIEQILNSLDLPVPLQIFTSSEVGCRKDRGDIWPKLIESLELRNRNFIHIGDNVISDQQNPGDFGLATYFTPMPFEIAKMIAPEVFSSFRKMENFDYGNQEANSAARLIQSNFSSPFIGE
jgi:FMN phosphatase YigB (HAD superfamily)